MTSPERRKLVQNDLTYAAQIWTSLHGELGLALTAERGEIHSGGGATGLPAPPPTIGTHGDPRRFLPMLQPRSLRCMEGERGRREEGGEREEEGGRERGGGGLYSR